MQRHAVLELGNIIIPRLPGIIRIMQPDTQVQTKNKKVQIVTQAKSRAQSNLFREILQRKFTIRAVLRISHTLPASRNTAPCKSAIIRKRYSILASMRISPTWLI